MGPTSNLIGSGCSQALTFLKAPQLGFMYIQEPLLELGNAPYYFLEQKVLLFLQKSLKQGVFCRTPVAPGMENRCYIEKGFHDQICHLKNSNYQLLLSTYWILRAKLMLYRHHHIYHHSKPVGKVLLTVMYRRVNYNSVGLSNCQVYTASRQQG